MKKFRLLKHIVVMLLVFALAGMASAQLSLSFPAYSEEKTSFEPPSNFQMIMYVGDDNGSQGSYNASNGMDPSIIRGGWLDVMLVNFNIDLISIELRFVHPALLADQNELKRMSKEDQGWVSGKKSDTAYIFHFDTNDLPPLHSVAVLRMKTKTRTRHSAPILSFIRWVSTSTQRSDQGFVLMVQDLPPSAGHIPMSDLMQMGMFGGFRSRWATLPQDPMRTINQVIPGQSTTAGSQQTQGNGALPPDLDLPGSSSNTNNLLAQQGGSGLPPDLSLPVKKVPEFCIRFSNERLGRAVGKLINGELAEAMRTPYRGNTVEVSKAQATIYVWSDEPFEGEIRCGDNSVPLAVFRAEGKYWARACGATQVLPDSQLVIKSGGNTRMVNFTTEVK